MWTRSGSWRHSGNRQLVPRLRELWNRQRATAPVAVNWDPAAAERVVDLHLILALYKLGDTSLLPQVAPLAARAESVLRGPDSEYKHAAQVVREIHSLWVLQQLVALGGPSAVRILELLNLPAPPSGGPVEGFPQLTQPVSFTIQRLSEELHTIAHLSNGQIALSYGVEELLQTGDYERGNVQRTDTNLAQIVTQELDAMNLTYSVTRNGVVICTFAEAAARWQQLWPEYSRKLAAEGWS